MNRMQRLIIVILATFVITGVAPLMAEKPVIYVTNVEQLYDAVNDAANAQTYYMFWTDGTNVYARKIWEDD